MMILNLENPETLCHFVWLSMMMNILAFWRGSQTFTKSLVVVIIKKILKLESSFEHMTTEGLCHLVCLQWSDMIIVNKMKLPLLQSTQTFILSLVVIEMMFVMIFKLEN